MTITQAINALKQSHCSYSGGPVSERAEEARRWLESQGHTVTVKSRPGKMGDGPSSMVFLNGSQVA